MSDEPEYLPMSEHGWLIEGGLIHIDSTTEPNSIIHVRAPAKHYPDPSAVHQVLSHRG